MGGFAFLERIYAHIPERVRLFAFIAPLCLVCVAATFLSTNDRMAHIVVAGICVLLIWLAAQIALPREERVQRTIRFATWSLMIVSLAVVGWTESLVSPLLAIAEYYTGLPLVSKNPTLGQAGVVLPYKSQH